MWHVLGVWAVNAKRVVRALGEDLLGKVLNATPHDTWTVRVESYADGCFRLTWRHTRKGHTVGEYTVYVRVGATLADTKAHCTCPAAQRHHPRLGHMCKHSWLSTLLLLPNFADAAASVLHLLTSTGLEPEQEPAASAWPSYNDLVPNLED